MPRAVRESSLKSVSRVLYISFGLLAATLLLSSACTAAAGPLGAPQLLTVIPSVVQPQSSEDAILTGQLTSFQQGASTISFGAGITVNSVTVSSATVLIANITVANTAVTGTRDITVTTGAQALALNGIFMVESGSPNNPRPLSTKVPPGSKAMSKFYSIQMSLEAVVADSKLDLIHMLWMMDGELELVPDPAALQQNNSSFIPMFVPDNNFSVTNVRWTMIAPDGTEINLTSSPNFKIPMGTPTLNLADPNPVLTLPFTQPIPNETVEVEGRTEQTAMFGSMLMTVLGTNALTLPQVEAMTGNTSNSVSAPANQTALNQAAQQVSAHKGDLEWITSATGQAAIAALQQQAMAQVSIPASRAAPGQVAATFSNLRLPWVIQSMAPVYDDPLKIENGGIDIELNVSVRLLETN